ncbi:MAG TPA: Hsp70 family protein [Pilimelia sp.]|nr:Hsp70 family protein [Pilimelia sp.]
MAAGGFGLGVDFGTSNTVAVLAWPDGRVKPVLFDGSPLLPSAVYADPDGGLLVGRDAVHAARARPECFEPNPKRRIDEGLVLLGEVEVPVVDLIAAVFGRVAGEARRITGTPVPTRLTCPAGWGSRRRRILLDAAVAAGIPDPDVVAEPVAAASYFLEVVGARVPVGSAAVVYDFGAGTFDASVVRRAAGGFEVLATEGLPDAGGLDIDAAVVAYLGAVHSPRDGDAWRRLTQPATPAERRANRLLWEDVRVGKEMLSRAGSTLLYLPLLDTDTPLGREQLEHLAGPIIDRTVAATRSALRAATANTAEVAAVFLVGGSSRIPLVATALHRALGVPPTVIEQPELVVAEGSLRTRPQPAAAVAADTRPPPAAPAAAPVSPASPLAVPSPSPATRINSSPPTPAAHTTARATTEPAPTGMPEQDVRATDAGPPPAHGGSWPRGEDQAPRMAHATAPDLSEEVGESGGAARGRLDRPGLLVAVGLLWLVTLFLPMYTELGHDDSTIDMAEPSSVFILVAAGIAATGAGLYRLRPHAGRPSLIVAVFLTIVVFGLSVLLALSVQSDDYGFGPAGVAALVVVGCAVAYLVMMLVARRRHSAAR